MIRGIHSSLGFGKLKNKPKIPPGKFHNLFLQLPKEGGEGVQFNQGAVAQE
jgi:hypothetical protein